MPEAVREGEWRRFQQDVGFIRDEEEEGSGGAGGWWRVGHDANLSWGRWGGGAVRGEVYDLRASRDVERDSEIAKVTRADHGLDTWRPGGDVEEAEEWGVKSGWYKGLFNDLQLAGQEQGEAGLPKKGRWRLRHRRSGGWLIELR